MLKRVVANIEEAKEGVKLLLKAGFDGEIWMLNPVDCYDDVCFGTFKVLDFKAGRPVISADETLVKIKSADEIQLFAKEMAKQ